MPFPAEPDVWYHMKLRVDVAGDKGTARGKVWKKADPEPAEWTITLEDPIVVQAGRARDLRRLGDRPLLGQPQLKVNE